MYSLITWKIFRSYFQWSIHIYLLGIQFVPANLWKKNPCKLYTKGWQISYQLMQDWRESGADIHFLQEKVKVSRWQIYKHICFFKSDFFFFVFILTCKFIRMANQVLMSFWEVMKLIGDSGKPSYLLKENCH